MGIMGLQEWALSAAHAATYAAIFALIALVAAGILQPSVFPTTDQSLLAAFLLCFMVWSRGGAFNTTTTRLEST